MNSSYRTEAVLTLAQGAPAGGYVVTLSSDSPAATVPSSVTVPASSVQVTVPVFTHRVSSPVNATITAATPTSALTMTWPIEPGNFLSFTSPPGEIVYGNQTVRYTATNSAFSAKVDSTRSRVTVDTSVPATGATMRLYLVAPQGSELTPGTYSGAMSVNNLLLLPLSLIGADPCGGPSSFTVHEVELAPPAVNRIHASFAQTCVGALSVQGEVFLNAPAVMP